MTLLDKNNLELVSRYEKFVNTSLYGTFFQSIHWSEVKDNWESDYIYIENDEGEIIAALSILSIKNNDKNTFMYAPRGPVCDLNNVELVEQLMEEADTLAKKKNAFLLRIDPFVAYDKQLVEKYQAVFGKRLVIRSPENPQEYHTSNPTFNMILNLAEVEDGNLMMYVRAKMRNQIRRTYRDQLKTRTVTVNDVNYVQALDKLYEFIKMVAKRNNISHRPKDYLDRVMRSFEGAVILETYTADQVVIASSIILNYNNKAHYLYSGSDSEYLRYNATYQLNYESIIQAIEQGKAYYDFGGVFGLDNTNNLYNYKNKFVVKGVTRFIGEFDFVYDQEQYDQFIGK